MKELIFELIERFKLTKMYFQRIHKLGKFNPEFQKKAVADWENQQEMEKEARER